VPHSSEKKSHIFGLSAFTILFFYLFFRTQLTKSIPALLMRNIGKREVDLDAESPGLVAVCGKWKGCRDCEELVPCFEISSTSR